MALGLVLVAVGITPYGSADGVCVSYDPPDANVDGPCGPNALFLGKTHDHVEVKVSGCQIRCGTYFMVVVNTGPII